MRVVSVLRPHGTRETLSPCSAPTRKGAEQQAWEGVGMTPIATITNFLFWELAKNSLGFYSAQFYLLSYFNGGLSAPGISMAPLPAPLLYSPPPLHGTLPCDSQYPDLALSEFRGRDQGEGRPGLVLGRCLSLMWGRALWKEDGSLGVPSWKPPVI